MSPIAKADVRRTTAARGEWHQNFFDAGYLAFQKSHTTAARTRSQVLFVERALGLARGSRILDVACGYGRHAALLARRGHDVVGVDLSPTMITEARREGKGRPRLRFVRADMRRLDLSDPADPADPREKFDAVINMFTSFGYHTDRENLATLKRMARALRPGGRILIDHRDRGHDERTIWDEGALRTWAEIRKGVFLLEDGRYDRRRGLVENTWQIVNTGRRDIWERFFRLRIYSLAEWKSMFRLAGLRLTGAYSDFDGRRPGRRSGPRLIVIGARVGARESSR